MVAMKSPHITPTLIHIQADFPTIKFSEGNDFMWSPKKKVVFVGKEPVDEEGLHYLLHEVGHALLDHQEYGLDIDLLRIETEAWDKAAEIAPRYKIKFNNTYAEEAVRTYKEWLHARSTCPECSRLGLQKTKNTYNCFNCGCSWRVPRSTECMIRRYVV